MEAAQGCTERDVDGQDEEEQQISDQLFASQKEALLFVIDVSQSMIQTSEPDSPSAVRHAIDCAYSFLKYKIIANPSDMVGILLYGTENTDWPESFPYDKPSNVCLLVDLDCPNAPGMRELRDALLDESNFRRVCAPAAQPPTLSNVLYTANRLFGVKAPTFNYKRIVLITDNDDPHAKGPDARRSAVTRARDLYGLGIKIEPIFISSAAKPFDTLKFYDELVFQDDDEGEENLDLVQEGNQRLQQMKDRIKAKASPKRAIFSIPLELAPDLRIGVKGYILYKEQKISKSTYIYNLGETPQFVKPETTNICVDTSKVLEKVEIRKAFRFGDERILFSEEELKSLKVAEDPILRIIGFKSFDKLHFWHNIRPSYFIYPHEATVVGSTRVFAALHKNLLAKEQWGLGWFIPRKNASPTVVAMIASQEVIGPSHVQISPPGIFLVTLPFADDIRANPALIVQRSPDELTESMSQIMKQLNLFEYDPTKYLNPALQWHWQTLQALALEEDMPEKKMDTTLPKYKGIEKRAGQMIRDWRETFDKCKGEMNSASTSKKRMGESESKGLNAKRAKQEPGHTTVDDMRRALQENQLQKLTLPVLKQVVSDYPDQFPGKPTSQKKADLIDFITSCLD